MGIANSKPKPPSNPAQAPQISSPAYQGISADAQYNPLKSLMTYVEGSAWTVEFFHQLLGRDNETSPQQVTREGAYQQYQRIQRYQLMVTQPLTQQFNSLDATTTIVGAATMLPGFSPNVGDMFVADIGDGRQGIFAITMAEPRSFLKDQAFVVEYTLQDYKTPDRYNDLLKKIVIDTVYDIDFARTGKNPVIQMSQYDLRTQLATYDQVLAEMYLDDFFSTEYSTLIIPEQRTVCYDPFLTRAVVALFDGALITARRRIQLLNCEGSDAINRPTLWDMLLRGDNLKEARITKRLGLVSSQRFERLPTLSGVRYSGVNHVMYPLETRNEWDRNNNNRGKLKDLTLADVDLQSPIVIPPENPVWFKNINVDSAYVLSESFYDQAETGQSILELTVRQALTNQMIDIDRVVALCKRVQELPRLERFYYIPIVIVLIRIGRYTV